jgi:hypothetical protein
MTMAVGDNKSSNAVAGAGSSGRDRGHVDLFLLVVDPSSLLREVDLCSAFHLRRIASE